MSPPAGRGVTAQSTAKRGRSRNSSLVTVPEWMHWAGAKVRRHRVETSSVMTFSSSAVKDRRGTHTVAVTRPEASWATVVSSGSRPISENNCSSRRALRLSGTSSGTPARPARPEPPRALYCSHKAARAAPSCVRAARRAACSAAATLMALASRTGVWHRRCKTGGRSCPAAVGHGNERRKIVERVVGLAGAVHPAIQAFAAGLAAALCHGVAQVGSGLAPGRQPFAYGLHGVAHGAQRAGHSLQPPGERGERRP